MISVYTTDSLCQLRLGLVALLINQARKQAQATQTIKKDGFMKNYMNFIRNFIM